MTELNTARILTGEVIAWGESRQEHGEDPAATVRGMLGMLRILHGHLGENLTERLAQRADAEQTALRKLAAVTQLAERVSPAYRDTRKAV